MELTQEQIGAINEGCPYNQGIFKEPFGIPDTIKELVIYTRWTYGSMGGSCWDDENTVNEYNFKDRPSDSFIVLDKVLMILKPSISYLEFKKIEALTQSNNTTDYGYYGDYTDETIEWIVLSELIEAIN